MTPKTLLTNPALAAHFAKLQPGERGAAVVPMTTMEFVTIDRTSNLGVWVKEHPKRGNGYRCGNVAIRLVYDDNGRPRCSWPRWFIFIRDAHGKWKIHHPKTRPYGYFHPSAAKIGAAMSARWQREKTETSK